jgi:hypothetical protein
LTSVGAEKWYEQLYYIWYSVNSVIAVPGLAFYKARTVEKQGIVY